MPAPHYNDFAASATVYMVFDSFAASTGASSAASNLAASDIKVFKDLSTTERSSASGITVTTSFDSRTGLQALSLDLSDNTDAGFYAVGHEYQVAADEYTIDGQTIRHWIGSFSIERANGVLAKLISGAAKVDVTKWLTGTIPAVNVTGVPKVDVFDWLGSGAPANTGDAYARLGAPAGASVSADIAAVKSETDTILTDVNTGGGAIYTRLGAPAGASIAADIAAVKTDSGNIYSGLTGAQAEPGQGAPAVNASPLTKLAYLYKAWRNKKTQTSTTHSLFADDATTVDQKSTVSDDGTTATRGEIASGP